MSSQSDVRLQLAQKLLRDLDQLLQSDPKVLLHASFLPPQLLGSSSRTEKLQSLTRCLQIRDEQEQVDSDSMPIEAHEFVLLHGTAAGGLSEADPDVSWTSTFTEDAREVAELLMHEEDSTDFDTQKLREAETLDAFFSAPHIMPPISAKKMDVHKRHPRGVELLPEEYQLTEIAYLPNMGARMARCVRKKRDPAKVRLTEEERRRMTAGGEMANCWLKVYYETDVERHFCVTQTHAVAEAINIAEKREKDDQNRLFPHRGLPGQRRPGQSSYSDVQVGDSLTEMKTPFSITTRFVGDLLDIDPAVLKEIIRGRTDHAFLFKYSPPSSLDDTMGVFDQPVVQLFTQLHDKEFRFGQGSSHKYSFFVIFDPSLYHHDIFIQDVGMSGGVCVVPGESS